MAVTRRWGFDPPQRKYAKWGIPALFIKITVKCRHNELNCVAEMKRVDKVEVSRKSKKMRS
jgi:hypothetical protein